MKNENLIIRLLKGIFSRVLIRPTDPENMIILAITGVIVLGIIWNFWKFFSSIF